MKLKDVEALVDQDPARRAMQMLMLGSELAETKKLLWGAYWHAPSHGDCGRIRRAQSPAPAQLPEMTALTPAHPRTTPSLSSKGR